MSTEEIVHRGIKRITNTEDGGVNAVPATWPGVLAMLLRRIIIDQFDGKGKPDLIPEPDERLTLENLEKILEVRIRELLGSHLSDREVQAEKSRLFTEFARDGLSIKTFGDFLTIMGFEWVDISVVINRPSGTVKSYTTHVGGPGRVHYTRPAYNDEYFEATGVHEKVVPAPETGILAKKVAKQTERKPRKKKEDKNA